MKLCSLMLGTIDYGTVTAAWMADEMHPSLSVLSRSRKCSRAGLVKSKRTGGSLHRRAQATAKSMRTCGQQHRQVRASSRSGQHGSNLPGQSEPAPEGPSAWLVACGTRKRGFGEGRVGAVSGVLAHLRL